MGHKKVDRAAARLARGNFVLPSPKAIRQAMTPAGGWTARTLAEWGVPWPPPKGWRKQLRDRWVELLASRH